MAETIVHHTLHELFEKYNCNVGKINYDPWTELDKDLKNYVIKSGGDKMGIVVFNVNAPREFGSIECYPIEQLLQLPVIVSSWHENACDDIIDYTEYIVVFEIYKTLIHCSYLDN
jgi:hypothetical protein